jgi:hypothetical protein
VTRFRITLDAYRCESQPKARAVARSDLAWVAPEALENLAMPAAHRRLARYLRA